MALTEKFANNPATTLSGNINNSVTDITPAAATSFPTSGQFRILIGTEIIIVGTVAAGVFHNCTRGAEGTTAAAHNNGDALTGILTAGAMANIPRSMTTSGDFEYLNSTLNPTRLAAPVDGSYVMNFASAVPTWIDLATASGIPAGVLFPYGGTSAPSGFLLCDGSAISRVTYATLFAAIGETYGAGNGSTTFNIPDTRGRTPIGAGTGSGLTARTLGASLGEENHVLSIAELATHDHSIPSLNVTSYGNLLGWDPGSGDQNVGGGTAGQRVTASGVTISGGTSNNGSSTGHNTMQPSLVFNFIIKT